MRIIRIIALLLVLCMLFPMLLACNGNKGGDGAATTTLPQGQEGVTSSLPSMNWDGATFLVLGRSLAGYPHFDNIEIMRDSMPDDVVGKAVWERNEIVKSTKAEAAQIALDKMIADFEAIV